MYKVEVGGVKMENTWWRVRGTGEENITERVTEEPYLKFEMTNFETLSIKI